MTRDANRPNKPHELLLWLRGRYPNDTNEELAKRFRDQREQLEGIIQQRYGIARDMVRRDTDAWLNSQS
jgi:hypothetical protein